MEPMLRAVFALGLSAILQVPTGCQQRADVMVDQSSALLAVGSPLPDLEGMDQNGKTHRLAENKGRQTLVYFYPKDGTPGCTKEACAFRDVWHRFEQAGIAVYGVSRDDRTSHERFAKTHRLPFPLISDPGGGWEKTFGVPNRAGMSARVSFLFDAQGKLALVYPNVDPGLHATQVLEDAAGLRG